MRARPGDARELLARARVALRGRQPHKLRYVLRRLLEAAGRGLWAADPQMVERLKELYADADDTVEGVR